jgi:hypothetical protein
MNFEELFAPPVGHHDTLNSKLWEGNERLKSTVRGALLRIAEDFIKFLNVPLTVEDLVITGGNANYSYTPHSDIDLHIIADLSNVPCDREVAELMDTKRLLYKQLNRDLEIYGIPVELYVEDQNHPAVSSGCYSVKTGIWLRKPRPVPEYDKDAVEGKTLMWDKIIKQAIMTGDLATERTAIKLLKDYRKLGLKTAEGEFSVPNLVYKSLRNSDQVRALQNHIDVAHTKSLSVQ